MANFLVQFITQFKSGAVESAAGTLTVDTAGRTIIDESFGYEVGEMQRNKLIRILHDPSFGAVFEEVIADGGTIVVPAGSMLHSLVVIPEDDQTVSIGRTPGGSEFLEDELIEVTTPHFTLDLMEYASSELTLHFTVDTGSITVKYYIA